MSRTPTPGWKPPPECHGCERPMRRADFRRQAGYCRICRPLGPSPVQALADHDRIDVGEWQELAAGRGAEERRRQAEREARRRARRSTRTSPPSSTTVVPLFAQKEIPGA